MQPFVLDIDGISDISEVLTSLINTVGNVLRGRISSMSYYPPALAKVNKVLNLALAHIPDEIFLSDDIYIQGNLDDSLLSTKGKDGYLVVPLDASLQSCTHPLNKMHDAHFS